MSFEYRAIGWNAQKKTYDLAIIISIAAYVGAFAGLGTWLLPGATIETLLIRALGSLALLMLHVILAIGPLCRMDRRLLPLLYNRRHLGVAMFFVAAAHAVFSIVQFHAFGDTNPLVSLLASNRRLTSLAHFPFELLGLGALAVLFVMAATSHDFWLHNLTPGVWKRIHMAVYLAYALVVGHVCLGALQQDRNPLLAVLLVAGLSILSALHLLAARSEATRDLERPGDLIEVCGFDDIPESRAKVVTVGRERVAVFRHKGTVSALSNVCRHQNGPLGEGKIIDGCITCPWHGYQYDPVTGIAPPPFEDRVRVFPVRVIDGRVWVDARPSGKT
jgi:methionine sulfoxide reductase heme-binding subunit